jgi:hypothetical protein
MKILVWKPEEKKLLERPKRKCMDDVEKDSKEVGCEDVDCVYLTRGVAVLNTVMQLQLL